MAVILKRDTTGKKCWLCGRGIDNAEAAIVSTGVRDVLFMHPLCAQSLSQQIFRDLSQLADLGIEVTDELDL